MRRIVLALIACSLLDSRALANAPEDTFGVSARVNAMGGAGNAISNDGFAAYHNPAGLSRCADHQMSMDIRHSSYGLTSTRVGADAPPDSTRPLRDPTRISIGACLRLPYHISAGISFGIGLEDPGTLRLDSGRSQPAFPMYGDSLEFLSVNMALAYRPVRQLAIGAGASILVNSELAISAFVPVGQPDAMGNNTNLSFNIGWHMKPTAAPYVGILVEPHRRIRIGMTYRGALAHHINLPMSITAVFLQWEVPIPMQFSVDSWYTPQSLSMGAAIEASRDITVSTELTWYDYGALAKSSFPYLNISEIPGTMGSVLGLVGIPNPDAPGFRSVWAARAGAEGRLLDGRLAIRGGYALRTSSLPDPGARNTTLLDGVTHSFTMGGGYAFGRRWDELESSPRSRGAGHESEEQIIVADAEPATEPEPALEGDAPATDGATTDGPAVDTMAAGEVPANRTARVVAIESINEDDHEPIELSARIDVFSRITIMPNQTSQQKDLRYGGHIFDVGATFTLGWR
jgi:long-subunit fatty acid transport protein